MLWAESTVHSQKLVYISQKKPQQVGIQQWHGQLHRNIIRKELPEEVASGTKNNFMGLNLEFVLTEKGDIS